MSRIVILGGGYAGCLAAQRLAAGGVRPRLVDSKPVFVERIRLHERAAGRPVVDRPYAELLGSGVDFQQARVLGVDRARKVVATDAGPIAYDRLILALGSVSAAGVPGVLDHAFRVGDVDGADALRRRLPDVRRVAVVGGGMTGIETASEIAAAFPHLAVTLVTDGVLAPDFAPAAVDHFRAALARLGVGIVERAPVIGVDAGGLALGTGALAADTVVWAASLVAPAFAREAGLDVTPDGRAVVDGYLRTSDESIQAIGDAAAVTVRGRRLRMGCATAMPMGAHVADVLLAGDRAREHRFAFLVRCVSVARADAVIQFVDADDHAAPRFLSGRLGALAKEAVCRFTVASLQAQRAGIGYRWPQGPRPARQLPVEA